MSLFSGTVASGYVGGYIVASGIVFSGMISAYYPVVMSGFFLGEFDIPSGAIGPIPTYHHQNGGLKCPSCSFNCRKGDVFCRNCGTRIKFEESGEQRPVRRITGVT